MRCHSVRTVNSIVKIGQYCAVSGSTGSTYFSDFDMLSSVHICFSTHISLLAYTKNLLLKVKWHCLTSLKFGIVAVAPTQLRNCAALQ